MVVPMHEKCLSRSVHSTCWTLAEDAEVGAAAAGAVDNPAAAATMAAAADASPSRASIESACLNASGLGEELSGVVLDGCDGR